MQVQYQPYTGQMYTTAIPNIAGASMWANPNLFNAAVKGGYIKLLNKPSSGAATSPFNSASISTNYTPNQYTAKQLAGYGSGGGGNGNTMPAWMHQAYANKMGGMGAPANGPLPYQITGSSFRGMPSGKAAPAGGK